MMWGYARIWKREYLTRDPDPLMAKLRFLVDYDLKETGIRLGDVDKMSAAQRDTVGQYLTDHDLGLHVHVHPDYTRPDLDGLKRTLGEELDLLARYHRLLRTPLVTTESEGFHRFMRHPSLEEQMDRLALLLAPVAQGCHELGLPFGIENHGDYYCSDLVGLCQRVPHLGIFLDTGNAHLIGEKPLPAFYEAAPYVVGTHFKDQLVQPNIDILHFEMRGSTMGEGNVPLRECYQILKENAPHPERLVMELEYLPPDDLDPLVSLDKSLAFIRSLE
jgi:sugar phosphate isomerase/epimerase